MSATLRPWNLEPDDMILGDHERGASAIVYWAGDVAECRQLHPISRADLDLIVIAVNAFDALLAVAKAAHADHTFQADSKRTPLADLDRALRILDAAHPGWREWTP